MTCRAKGHLISSIVQIKRHRDLLQALRNTANYDHLQQKTYANNIDNFDLDKQDWKQVKLQEKLKLPTPIQHEFPSLCTSKPKFNSILIQKYFHLKHRKLYETMDIFQTRAKSHSNCYQSYFIHIDEYKRRINYHYKQ